MSGSNIENIRDAIAILGQEGDSRALEPLNQILSEDTYSEVWADSINALGEIGDSRAVDPLIQILTNEKYSEIWQDSIRALGEIGDSRALRPIQEKLNSGSFGINSTGVWSIGEIIKSSNPQGGLEILLALLENDESVIRFFAASSLSQFNDSKCVEYLILALDDPVHMVRSAAVESLGSIGDVSALDPILDILRNDDTYVTRSNAVEALGKFGDTRALDDLVYILRNEDLDTPEDPEFAEFGMGSDEKSFKLSIVKTIAGFNDPVAIDCLEELFNDFDPEVVKFAKEGVQRLLSGSKEGMDGNDDDTTNRESYVAKGDAAGLVCPECSGCTMEFDPSMRYPWIDEEDSHKQFKLMPEWERESLWHGFNHRTERHCIFFCHSCEKEFSMGEIYDSPFKTSETRHGLPPLYVREKEEVIQEIMDSENRTGRNYIKAKQWYDDVRGEVDLRRWKIPVFTKFGLSEEVSRRLALSQFHQKNSSSKELRGDDTEEWINFINLTPRKIVLNCKVSQKEAMDIFQIFETERIKQAYSSRYWVIDPSNPNHKYEPELFSPSPVKGGDVDRDFIQEMEIEWNKIRRKKSFPEDARKWYEKYHLTRMGPL